MRDVRKDYPEKGVSMDFFHEWYRKDKKIDVMENLKIVRETSKKKLMELAAEKGLLYVALNFLSFRY